MVRNDECRMRFLSDERVIDQGNSCLENRKWLLFLRELASARIEERDGRLSQIKYTSS